MSGCRVRMDVWSDASVDPVRQTGALCMTHVLSAYSDFGRADQATLGAQQDQARERLRQRHEDIGVGWDA